MSVPLLLAILMAACIGLCGLELWRRHALYWYDTDQNYEYAFTSGHAFDVRIGDDGFSVPPDGGSWHSGVVAINVNASASGYWFEPCIELGPEFKAQCFERGGRGRRYLTLDPGLVDRNGVVAMRGRHMRWQSKTEPVWLFTWESSPASRVLVLAPHPDDAEIAAFGLYSSTISYVVTMTAGNYVDGLYRDLADSRADQDTLRGDVRTWDSLAVPLWGGVGADRTVNLGYPTYSLARYHDGTAAADEDRTADQAISRYRKGAVAQILQSRVASPDWDSVVLDLAAAIEAIQPTMIASPHPMLDAHTDHQYTTIALLEALARVGDQEATVLLYTNHHPASESYPFGPSQAMVPIPPWFESPLPVPGILSLPLAADAQLRKLFALEAMHDLRAPPLRLSGGPAAVLADRMRQAWTLILRDPFGDYSYYRRAVRPNELFLVYAPPDRPGLDRYLRDHFDETPRNGRSAALPARPKEPDSE